MCGCVCVSWRAHKMKRVKWCERNIMKLKLPVSLMLLKMLLCRLCRREFWCGTLSPQLMPATHGLQDFPGERGPVTPCRSVLRHQNWMHTAVAISCIWYEWLCNPMWMISVKTCVYIYYIYSKCILYITVYIYIIYIHTYIYTHTGKRQCHA